VGSKATFDERHRPVDELQSNDPKSVSSIMLISRDATKQKAAKRRSGCERPFAASYQAFTACCPRLSVALDYLQASARSGPHTSATPKQSQEKSGEKNQ